MHFSACSSSVKQIIIMLNFEHQISCFHVQQWPLSCWIYPMQMEKMPSLQNLTGSNLFLVQQVTTTSQFVSDWKIFPPDAFCGKIWTSTQRKNYIWNTDTSNLALGTKSQIFNDVTVLYISRKKTLIIFLPQNHHLQHFVFNNNEYEWLDNISKHCSEPPISIKFKTQQKSVIRNQCYSPVQTS